MNELNRRPVVVIAWITALCVMGDSMLYIVLPVYWREFGLDAVWQIGVLLAANRFVRLPLGPFVGWCYSRISMRTGVLLSVSIAAVTTLAYGVSGQFWPLLAARCLWGVAWSFLRLGGYLTVMACSTKDNRGQLMGRYNGVWGIGSLIGMLAGGLLADAVGILPIAAGFAALTLAGLPLAVRYVPGGRSAAALTSGATDASDTGARRRWRERLRSKEALFTLTAGAVISLIYFGMFASTMSRYIEAHHPLPFDLFGWTLGAASLAGTLQAIRWGWGPLLAPGIGRLADRSSRAPLFVAALLFAGFTFALAPLAMPTPIWLALLFLLLLGNTLVMTLADALAGDAAARNGAVAFMTAYALIIDIGAAIGPAASYALITRYSVDAVYVAAAVLLFGLAAVWVSRLRTEVRR